MAIENFKNIHLGSLIKARVKEVGIGAERICKFLECDEDELELFFESESINTNIVLRLSKLLKYDFFRLYSQHLILFSPSSNNTIKKEQNKSVDSPQFRKNLYNREIINFVLELIDSNEKTKQQIIDEYNIPKTTLYKWISKYKKNN